MAVDKRISKWATTKGINSDYFMSVPYVVNGYLVSVTNSGNYVAITIPVDREIPKDQIKAIKKELKAYKVSNLNVLRLEQSLVPTVLLQ